MTDKPIIFSGPMVRAILDGSKTQTRRVLKDQPTGGQRANFLGIELGKAVFCDGEHPKHHHCEEYRYSIPLKYAVGDLLWVREPWQVWAEFNDFMPSELPQNYDRGDVLYLADRPDTPWASRKRHARFMPRRFSRITLKVTDVRVQRVQDISEEDAKDEGCGLYVAGQGFISEAELQADPGYSVYLLPRNGFEAIWREINGPDAWDHNPWVAAYTFTPIFKNINEVKR